MFRLTGAEEQGGKEGDERRGQKLIKRRMYWNRECCAAAEGVIRMFAGQLVVSVFSSVHALCPLLCGTSLRAPTGNRMSHNSANSI